MVTQIKHYSQEIEKPCWRKNGVWGNEKPRCEKLKFVDHCRSCNIFEEAARAAMVAGSVDQEEIDEGLTIDDLVQRQRLAGDKSVLPFRLKQYCFAIPSNKIITIHDQVPIHSIPFNRNPVIRGVVAINHEIYTFVNFSQLLSLPPAAQGDLQDKTRRLYKRILVVDFNSRILAFYVDEVYQIYRYYKEAVNEEKTKNIFSKISEGYLLEEKSWCDDCYILDLKKISSEFENTFL